MTSKRALVLGCLYLLAISRVTARAEGPVEQQFFRDAYGQCRVHLGPPYGRSPNSMTCEQNCDAQEHPNEFHDLACTHMMGVIHRLRFDPVTHSKLPDEVYMAVRPPDWNEPILDIATPEHWRERLYRTPRYIEEGAQEFWATESGRP